MGFWIFMLVMNLLIPITMIGFGKMFMRNSPRAINGIFGYRTANSMKNMDTWQFAHKYFGKRWYKLGWLILLPSILGMIPVIGKDVGDVAEFGGLLGYAPIMPVNEFDCSAFIERKGRIPAPIHSFKN